MGVPPVLLVIEPRSPVLAHSVLFSHEFRTQLNLILILPNIQAQPTTRMPRNMTMQDPLARIIRAERNRHIPMPWQQRHIASGGIIILESPIMDIVGMERPIFLRHEHKIVAVEMHGVSDGHEDAFPASDLFGRALRGHDDVDPVFLVEVLGDESVFGVVEAGVTQVVDQWVLEIQPHGRVQDVPAGEVAVGDGVVDVGDFDADFEVVACVGIDWWGG